MIKYLRKYRYRALGVGIIGIIILLLLSLRINNISVTGNSQYSKEEIIQLLFPESADYNTVYCYAKDQLKEHRKIPFVEDYKIVFQSWNRIEIIIYEKSVVGYVSYMGNYLYFDKDGIVVESSHTEIDRVPQVTGLQFGHIILYQPLPVEDQTIFDEILNLTQILSVYDLKVDKVYYDNYKNAVLYLGEIQVILGDSRQMNGKIAELSDIFPEIEGLSGILYLDTYDENNKAIRYTFKRK